MTVVLHPHILRDSNLAIKVKRNGVEVPLTLSVKRATQASVYPAYPEMLSGWVMQTDQIDTSTDQGWTQTAGVRNTDQAINRASNTSFGQGTDFDAMVVTVTYDGTNYYSSDAQAKFCSIPDNHVVEYYCKMGPLGGGSFPSVWERPNGTGDGELDHFEWKGKWWLQSPTDPNRDAMNVITTLNGSYTNSAQKPTNLALDANGIDPQEWHHYRYRKTATDVTLWIDGIQVGQITRSGASGSISNAEWDRCFASGHPWYLRVSYQFGIGSGSNAGGTPDPSLCPTQLWVRDIRIWEKDTSTGTGLSSIGGTGVATNTATQSYTLPAGTNLPAGTKVLVAAACAAKQVISISDSKANVWSTDVAQQGTVASYVSTTIFSSTLTTDLVGGDTITISVPTAANLSLFAAKLNGVTRPASATAAGAGSGTSYATTNSATATAGALVVAVTGITSANGNTNYTPGSGWIKENAVDSGRSIALEWRVSPGGAETGPGSGTGSFPWAEVLAVYPAS